MENDSTMVFVSKCVKIHVEYQASKISILSKYNMSLIYSCWVTYIQKQTKECYEIEYTEC